MLWASGTSCDPDRAVEPANSARFYNAIWGSQKSRAQEEKILFLRKKAIDHSYALLGIIRNKKLLEIGCGSGKQAIFFALKGAEVSVIDASDEALKAVSILAREKKASIQGHRMNAEALEFESQAFDSIYINSVLMHVNPEKVLQECSRVLKPGGKLVITEPLRYAPFVQVYRWLSSYRTTSPQYATLKMFEQCKKHFTAYSHKEFYFFSSALLPLGYVKNPLLKKVYAAVNRIDDYFIKIVPPVQKFCWISVVEYVK